ncbi:type IV toxin-antitoxin system AbiEi family antitoxin domain-containing protein [Mesorhizobium sp.]|uniref:type IV toxin-antitoxin system AbiEi family antitoxin domain-containing protein n=1 Tax=Mesorhizobium sp. TaxID=1871066 RepID=UPI0033905BAD
MAPRAERNCELCVADPPQNYARALGEDAEAGSRPRRADPACRRPEATLRERAVSLAREKGEVRTKDLTDIGVPRHYLTRMCEEGLLMKAGYGRYRAAVPKAA